MIMAHTGTTRTIADLLRMGSSGLYTLPQGLQYKDLLVGSLTAVGN